MSLRLFLPCVLIAIFSIQPFERVLAQEALEVSPQSEPSSVNLQDEPLRVSLQAEPLKVLILPFELHSVEDISELSQQLLEELALNLDRTREIEILDRGLAERFLAEGEKITIGEEEAIGIARKQGADFAILGSLTKLGTVLSIDLRILNISLNRLFSHSYAEAQGQRDLISKLSSLIHGIEREILTEALRLGKVFIKERDLIGKVSISGNRRIGAAAIMARVKSKEGRPFSNDVVREDLRTIYDMGFFSDIVVDITDTAAGREITFIVKEKPTVKEILITGNKDLKEERIKEVITIQTNTLLDRTVLKENIEKIKRLYTNEGYYLARVESIVEPGDKDEVVVNFVIEEGKKVKVKRINFVGNRVFRDKELKRVMNTKEVGLFSFITGSGVFEEDIFENDINIILNKYFDNGYIQAEVGSPKIQLSDDKRWLFITLNIVEGEQYRIGSIEFQGEILETRSELLERLETAPGKVFSRKVLRRDIIELTDFYADKGYAFVDITPLTRLDQEERKVDLTFSIEKGDKVFIEKINISGNTKTRDKVIRREIELAEGTLFSSTKLKRSRRNLNRLGFFDVANITTDRGSVPDRIVLNVDVEERPTGSFAVGAGYSSVDNFIATVSISQNNLFGTGRRLKADVTLSGTSQRYEISFTEPWLLDRPISAGFDLFRINREFPDFTRFSNGGDIRFGFPVYQDTRLFLTYKLEQVKITGVAEDAALIIKEQEGERIESSLSTLLKRDTRDSILDTTEGSVESISIEFAGGPLGGDNNFVKYFLDMGKYFPMPFKTTLLLRGRIGFIHSFDGKDVPIYERFFLGGLNTVRGFKTRSIGPRDPTTNDVIGGDKELIFNIEYIFPIVPQQRVKGVVFFDAGNAYATGENYDFSKLRTGAGGGIRWLSPLGLLRLEWGFNLDREAGEKSSQFEFSIGGSF